MKIKELLTDESKWTKRATARNDAGTAVTPKDPRAVCFCLLGAAIFCYAPEKTSILNHRDQIISQIGDYLGRVIDVPVSTEENAHIQVNAITRWNDEIATFKQVRRLVETLDI